jgi:hypothetical protein
MARNRNNNPVPAGYGVQFGYGIQPASKAQVYVDVEGVELKHTFTEINGLFGSGGENYIGVSRTGSIASGSTLAQSMDSIEQAIENSQGYLGDLEYWFKRNTKSIVGMERNENWDGGEADTSNWLIGYQGIRLEEDNNTGSTIYATWAFESKDLTTFNDGSESSEDDYIRFCFYVSDGAFINQSGTDPGLGVSLLIATDPTAATDRWRLDITSIPDTYSGWVYVDAPKSSFYNDGGTPDWSDIQAVRIAWRSLDNALGEYVTFDDVWMCRKDPIEDSANPFQREINGVFTRDFTIKDGYWYVGDAVIAGYLYMLDLQRTSSGYGSTPAALQGQQLFTDFKAEALVFVQTGSGKYTNMLTWEINDTQRVKCFIYDDLLYIYSHFDTEEKTDSIPFIAKVGELVILTLEKVGSTITARARQSNNYNLATVSLEINTTKAGYLAISNNGTWTPILTLAISTTEYASVAGRAYMIGRFPWFSVVARDNFSYDYYINPVSGDDSYDGRTSTEAFRTIQRLLLEPFAYTYVRNGIINVLLASGTYEEDITLPAIIGSGTMNWLGDAADASSVLLQKISANACNVYVTFQDFTLTTTGTAVYINKCNSIYLYNIQATANGAGSDYGVQAYYSNVYCDACLISNKNAAFVGNFPGTHILTKDCVGADNTYSMYMALGAIGHIIGTSPGSVNSSFAASGSQIIL